MRAAFATLTDDFVRCRTLLHAWTEDDDPPEFDIQAVFAVSGSVESIVFKCSRCRGYRIEGWSKVTGDLLWRVYRLPREYRLPRGADATRKKMRREYLERRASTTAWEAPRRRGKSA